MSNGFGGTVHAANRPPIARPIGRRWGALVAASLLCGAGVLLAQSPVEFARERERLVREDVEGAGVKNPRVLDSMRKTPRHEFMLTSDRKIAYVDTAVPIGHGQTISPPFVVAYMTEQLDPQPTDVVLEIGTGSGYQAAVLSPLVKEVYTIEIVEELGKRAAKALKKLNYNNVECKVGDGYLGWPEHAPFDKIIVTCSPEKPPVPLVEQLKEGGRMVIPLGERYQQVLYILKKENGKLVQEALRPTLFVPMTGKAEELRQVLPDPTAPAVLNGGFEDLAKEGDAPLTNWHYLRQAKVIEDKLSPEGVHYIQFFNNEPGVNARSLQAFGIDGRKIKQLSVSAMVKLDGARPGGQPSQLPQIRIGFYAENHAPCGEDWVGPWHGTFDWTEQTGTINVPLQARSAILQVGLLGGVGTASFDKVKIFPIVDPKKLDKEKEKERGKPRE